jgi:RNA polymerase sigma-70 factor, ECF subfamily
MTSEDATRFQKRRADDERATLSRALVAAGLGERSAFEDVYRRTSAKLFGICLRIFANRQDAEDALQDAYITIWNKAGTYNADRASPITWLAAVTRNRAIDRLRSRRNAGSAPLDEARDVADPQPLADATMMADADNRAITDCIKTLDTRDGDFISSAFLKGATYAELAERDGMPLGTVKSRVRRALLKLKACLSACEGDDHGKLF